MFICMCDCCVWTLITSDRDLVICSVYCCRVVKTDFRVKRHLKLVISDSAGHKIVNIFFQRSSVNKKE